VVRVTRVDQDASHERLPDLIGPDLPGGTAVGRREHAELRRGGVDHSFSGSERVDVRCREPIVLLLERPAAVLGDEQPGMAADEDAFVGETPAHRVGAVERLDLAPGPAAVGGDPDPFVPPDVQAGGGRRSHHERVEVTSHEWAAGRRRTGIGACQRDGRGDTQPYHHDPGHPRPTAPVPGWGTPPGSSGGRRPLRRASGALRFLARAFVMIHLLRWEEFSHRDNTIAPPIASSAAIGYPATRSSIPCEAKSQAPIWVSQ